MLTEGDRRTVLEGFARALGREVHVLVGEPELTWQQLHNRLQWEGDPIAGRVAAEAAARSGPVAPIWARSRTPYRESGSELRTLTGHGSHQFAYRLPNYRGVSTCAVSPDGTWIVSAGRDQTLKVWDAATGTEVRTLTGHRGPVLACAISPDGTWIVSASADNTLKVWDAATGTETRHPHRPHKPGHGMRGEPRRRLDRLRQRRRTR